MKTARKTGAVAGLGAIACSLGVASIAWACSPTFNLKSNPPAGAANTEVTISGTAFTSGDSSSGGKGNLGPVEIRWNSITGTQLGSAAGPSFSIKVTIPNAKQGFYSIVSVQRSTDSGQVVGKASAAFEVTAAASSAPPAPSDAPNPEQSASTAQPTSPGASQGGSAPETSPSSGSSEPTGAAAAENDDIATAPTTGATASAAPSAAAAETSATAAPAPPAVDAVAGPASTPPDVTEAPPQPTVAASPGPATVWGDLWHFSEPAVEAWPTQTVAVGLADSPASSESSSTRIAVGAALFSAGFVALGATPLLALRRRRPLGA